MNGEIYLDPCLSVLDTSNRQQGSPHVLPLRPVPFDTTDGAGEPPRWPAGSGGRPVNLITAQWRDGESGPARRYYRLSAIGGETLQLATADWNAAVHLTPLSR